MRSKDDFKFPNSSHFSHFQLITTTKSWFIVFLTLLCLDHIRCKQIYDTIIDFSFHIYAVFCYLQLVALQK